MRHNRAAKATHEGTIKVVDGINRKKDKTRLRSQRLIFEPLFPISRVPLRAQCHQPKQCLSR
jgi:hypothetical protein